MFSLPAQSLFPSSCLYLFLRFIPTSMSYTLRCLIILDCLFMIKDVRIKSWVETLSAWVNFIVPCCRWCVRCLSWSLCLFPMGCFQSSWWRIKTWPPIFWESVKSRSWGYQHRVCTLNPLCFGYSSPTFY